MAETGTPDILVNCSGWVHHGTILDCDELTWDRSFDLNVKAHYRMIRAYLPAMVAARRRFHRQHRIGGLIHQGQRPTASSMAPPRGR